MHSISVAALRNFAKEAKVTLAPGQPMLFGSSKPVALPKRPGAVAAAVRPKGDVSRGAMSVGDRIPSQPIPFRAPGSPLDFSGKTAAIHQLTKTAFFDELTKIADMTAAR